MVVARGLGGSVPLYPGRVEIDRAGILSNRLALAGLVERETRTVLYLRQIGVAHIVQPYRLPGYLRFTCGGAPPSRNRYGRDIFAENALSMHLLDNRGFSTLVDRLHLRQRRVA